MAEGDRVFYPFDAGMPNANLLAVKLLIYSVISTPGARFFTMDIKNFYLCTPMTRNKYMQLKLSNMPEDVIAHYHLLGIATTLMGTSTAKSASESTGSRKWGSLSKSSWQKG